MEKIVFPHSSQEKRGMAHYGATQGSTGDRQEADGSGNCEQEPLLCFPQEETGEAGKQLKVV